MVNAEDIDLEGRWVFLSGPMTGVEGDNLGAFDRVAARVHAAGARNVHSPAEVARAWAGYEMFHADWMALSLHELCRLVDGPYGTTPRPAYDTVVLLDGWRRSAGCLVEKAAADAMGLNVVEARGW